MSLFTHRLSIFLALCLIAAGGQCAIPSETSRFDFSTNGNAQGWTPTHSLSPFSVSGGVLTTQITDNDPYMTSPVVSFSASTYRYLSLRMKSTAGDRNGEIFFATSSEPTIDAKKSVVFEVIADGQWHTYTIDMSVNSKWTGTITRYRLDPASGGPNGGTIQIDNFLSLSAPPALMWDFGVNGDVEGWTAIHSLAPLSTGGGLLQTSLTGVDPYMHSPQISLNALSIGSIAVNMRVHAGNLAQVFWITSDDPVWNETKSKTFPMTADGSLHPYEVVLEGHPSWKGTVTRMRIDPTDSSSIGSQVRFDSIWLLPSRNHLAIESFGPDRTLIPKNSSFAIHARVKNMGTATIPMATLSIELSPGMALSGGLATRSLENIPNEGGEAAATWNVSAGTSAGIHTATLTIDLIGNPAHNRMSQRIFISNPAPAVESIPSTSHATAFFDAGGNLVLQSAFARLVALANPGGHSPVMLYARTTLESPWKLAGVLATLEPLTLKQMGQSNPVLADVLPGSASILMDQPDLSSIRLSPQVSGFSDAGLSCQLDFSITREGRTIDCTARLGAGNQQDFQICRFAPLTFKVGEGSFGSQQKQALFPGVEWLVSGEVSSSTLDIAAPGNIRFAPDPHWITVPSMGVFSNDGLLCGLAWEATQEWAPGKIMPAAAFASPNFLENQNNHYLSLFLPSIPDHVLPNQLTASLPYDLLKNSWMDLEARIILDAAPKDTISLVDHWLDLHGHQPAAYPINQSLEKSIEISRQALLTTLWGSETRCWQHATGFACSPTPGLAYLLWLDYLETGSTAARDRALDAVTYYRANNSPGILSSQTNMHIFGWQAPFVFGDWHGSIDSMVSYGVGLSLQMRSDGSYPPFGDASLVDPNGRELGWTARRAYSLVSLGRQLKRSDFLTNGKKSLDHMKTFSVPRAAQTWEIPQHTPDILAAAQAVEAYVAGYEAFQRLDYLYAAIYWARAGLPFVWFWNPPEWVTMRYGSVPVFGATFYTGSWFGRAVQWNGLVYAHALNMLAEHDSSYPWKQIADGITVSALHQQVAEPGPLAGTYPDGWNMVGNYPQPVYINPENILKNIFYMEGRNPNLTTLQMGSPNASDSGTVLATSRCDHLSTAQFIPRQFVSIEISNPIGETSRILVAGFVMPAAGGVWVDGIPLEQVNDIDAASQGWRKKNPYILIRVPQSQVSHTISIGVPPAAVGHWQDY